MTQNQSSNQPSSLPVFYIHAKGRGQASPQDVQALLELGCPVCSRIGAGGSERTDQGLNEPGKLLRELAERYPDRPVAFIRAGLRPTLEQISELTSLFDHFDGPLALTLLSNAIIDLNPFADLQAPTGAVDYEPADLVELLAPGFIHTLKHWADHFALLSPASVERMAAAESGGTLMQLLSDAGGRLVVPDHLFLHDENARIFQNRKLEPHESVYPPPFGDLSARLQDWINAGITRLPYPATEPRAATLHISHSWGGGIAHWIDTFIDTDREHVHFQLCAEGPQSDVGCGQRLSLYAGNELNCAVASWWMQPPIRSVEDHNEAYRKILGFVCRRYRVGRIIVSSLIGHSLDALRTGLPTLQVLHDHFPLWPLLSVNPRPYLRAEMPVDIEKALAEQPRKQEFTDKDAKGWRDLQSTYVKAISEYSISLAAPSRAVLDLQTRLEPGLDTTLAQVIPHGSTLTHAQASIERPPRPDGRMGRVGLGRIQTG